MKLTAGLNFINVLLTAYTLINPKSVKNTVRFLQFLHLWAEKLLVKLSPGHSENDKNLFMKHVNIQKQTLYQKNNAPNLVPFS